MEVTVGQLEALGPKPREVWLTFGMSVLLHGLLVAGVVLIPHFRVGTYITVPVSYTVSLVSAPPGGRGTGAPAPSPAPAAPPAPTQPAPRVAPAPPPAPRPVEELTLPGRQATRTPTKSVEPSLRPPTSLRPETTRPAPPRAAPPASVPAPPPPVAAAPAPSAPSAGTGAAVGTGKSSGVELAGEGAGAGGGTALAAYLSLVDWKIQSNWVPVAVAGAPEVTVVIRFRVLRSGQVRDVELDAGSGNASVDTSALRAIRQSLPLPPFPNLLTEPYLDLRYRFVMERG